MVGAPPSMDTAATPQTLHLTPIQLTAVPVKRNIAVEATVLAATMVPPLKVPDSEPKLVQAPIWLVASSSERVVLVAANFAMKTSEPPRKLVWNAPGVVGKLVEAVLPVT